MRGQHAAVSMHQRAAALPGLARARLAGELALRLGHMRHSAGDPAMAVGEQPAMGVQRKSAARVEIPSRTRAAAPPRGAMPISSSRICRVIVNES